MKKFICLFFAAIICFSSIFSVNATSDPFSNTDSNTVIVYDNGDYLTISPIIYTESTTRAANTKDGHKTYTYSNSSDEVEWIFVINATFSYVYGSSVTCTNSSYTYTIYKDSWKFSDGSTSRSGGTAYAYGTFKNKVLFITTRTVDVEAQISCDIYGNLS